MKNNTKNRTMKTYKAILMSSILCLFTMYLHAQKQVNPYNPEPKMDALKAKMGKNVERMHFLVFGDSKGSRHFSNVLKRADSLQPDFCITTADLVNKGGGERGKADYKKLDSMGGWFMRKYAMWPTVGNHEEAGGDDGIENYTNFYGMKKDMYSFEYGNAKFIALPWPKVKDDRKKLKWLEKELKAAKGKHIFIFRHRPFYTVGQKKYSDVEGIETDVTKLFDTYKVTAVFSGHDHIYYRTKRNHTSYIISAGAGASIYKLNREEKDAIEGDVYYGRRTVQEVEALRTLPKLQYDRGYGGVIQSIANSNIVFRSVKVDGDNVTIELTTEKEIIPEYKFHGADGTITALTHAMYYVLSVKIDGDTVSIEMIDEKTGKVWDKATIEE